MADTTRNEPAEVGAQSLTSTRCGACAAHHTRHERHVVSVRHITPDMNGTTPEKIRRTSSLATERQADPLSAFHDANVTKGSGHPCKSALPSRFFFMTDRSMPCADSVNACEDPACGWQTSLRSSLAVCSQSTDYLHLPRRMTQKGANDACSFLPFNGRQL